MMPEAPAPAKPAPGKNAFLFVIATVTLDMMSFGIIMPVLPSLLKDVMGLEAADSVAWGGALSATFAILNFLVTPLLGNLSDRFGRRPVLIFSIATLALDFLIMGFAHSIWMLFLGRALTGISSATFSTANAYIADVTEPEDRGRAFGMMGAAFGVGFIIGPALGAAFSTLGPRAPFFAAAGLSALNFIYGWFVLPESLAPEDRRSFDWKRANPFGAFHHFRKLPKVVWFIVVAAIYQFAHMIYPSTWNFHGKIRYNWEDWQIGLSLTLVGLGSAIVQALCVGPIIKRIGPFRAAQVGITINILSLFAYSMAGAAWMVFVIMPFSMLGGLVNPALNTITSNLTPSNSQGELHGATASIQALANIFSPIVLTQTLGYFSQEGTSFYFPGAAFLLACFITCLAMIPFLIGVRANRGFSASSFN